MDINANEDPNEIDYAKVPLDAMRQSSCTILSRSLNPTKVLLSEEGIYRDWRGIAYLAGLCSLYGPFMSAEKDPMAKVLSLWRREGDNQTANFDNLLKFLGKIDRWDVADDLTESLAEDAKAFKSKKYQEQLIIARQEASAACDDFSKDMCGNFTPDQDILTNDDVQNAMQGLPPQMYDAFVLFADEDYNFAMELITRLEEKHPKFDFKICVKDRDLVGGISIEHEAIMRIIKERCHRLIVIVSAAFLKSAANTFFTNFAAALQIEQRRRKIVPCLYEPCELPTTLSFYFNLKYYNTGRYFNFWDKLSDSIRITPFYGNMNGVRINPMPNIQIEEVKEEQTQKAITSSVPVKVPRRKNSKVPEPLKIAPEPRLRGALSMNQLNSLAINDNNNDNYRSECDLSSVHSFDTSNLPELSSSTKSSRSGKTKWYKLLLPSISAGSKTDLPVGSSMSFDSIEKPKRKKNWLKKRLMTSDAT
ncbi:myeloid differentiation primary response protein MyD88 [Episyrphus balteatus]|uniref:myeloid differentiation primary response protein MyD88 n=1 Tax=Episyrphus balteatus TaxID=286459 RepID=UPI0024854CF4|nr:myeloid differentiation primary response protein MyD88 [Episyrphus balteatus]